MSAPRTMTGNPGGYSLEWSVMRTQGERSGSKSEWSDGPERKYIVMTFVVDGVIIHVSSSLSS